jgi:hypothetical protein
LFSVSQLGLNGGVMTSPALLQPLICDVCTHWVLFAPGNPEEAEKRWRRS